MSDIETECRARFQRFCELYAEAAYHSMKAHYVKKAYEQIEIYLDHRDIQNL